MTEILTVLQAVASYAVIGCVLIAAVNVWVGSKPNAQDVFFGMIWPLTLAFMILYAVGSLCRAALRRLRAAVKGEKQ